MHQGGLEIYLSAIHMPRDKSGQSRMVAVAMALWAWAMAWAMPACAMAPWPCLLGLRLRTLRISGSRIFSPCTVRGPWPTLRV
jgi:hypothetical protein